MSLMSRVVLTLSIGLALLSGSQAQNCAGAGKGTAVTAAKGFSSYLLAKGLTSPRGLVFDPEGNLLVSQRVTKGNVKENGIFGLKLKDEGGCVSVVSKELVAAQPKGAVSVLSSSKKQSKEC
jgi:glucose/arabinose dehydrogenase